MAKDFARTDRVGEQIRRELAELVRLEVKDPRVRMVTLTEVEVAADYSHAKVFYTTLEDQAAVQRGLDRASGFLRSQLAQRIKLRIIPQLHFVYDAAIERGDRLSRLIDQAVASDHRDSDRND
ncbi:MAG: 30S ribosome-binding factor RbfA [Pseudomonadota bacterium]